MNNTTLIVLQNGTIGNQTLLPLSTVRKMSTSEFILVAIYCVIFTLGFLGNLLVVHYFSFKNKIKRLYHIYLIHLAIADLISSSFSSSYFVFNVVSGRTWYLGELPCKLISLIGPVTVNVSAWLLVSIAYERYRGIISPFKARLTKLRIHLTVAAIWLFSLLLLIPYALSIHLVDGWCRMKWSSPLYELAYAVGTLLLQSLVPIIYMKFTVDRILCVLRNRMTQASAKSSKYSACSRETSFMSNSFRVYSSSKCLAEENAESERETFNEEDKLTDYETRRGSHASQLNQLVRKPREKTLSVPSLAVPLGSPKTNRLQELLMPPTTREHLTATSQPLLETYSVELPRKRLNRSQEHIVRSPSPQHYFTASSLLTISGRASPACERNIKSPTLTNNKTINRQRNTSVYRRICKIFGAETKDKNNPVRQQQRIRLLVVTFSVFVVCSLPYNIFYVVAIIIYDFIKDHSQLELLSNINLWLSTLVLSNSVMNCFIYAGMDTGFKIYCKRLFTCQTQAAKSERLTSERTLRMQRQRCKLMS